MKRAVLCCAGVLVGLLAASAGFAAWGPDLKPIRAEVAPGQFTEADTFQITGVCSDAELSVGGCCLFDPDPSSCGDGGDPDEIFTGGDSIAISTYWNEVVDCSAYNCASYQAVWSLAIAAGGPLLFLFENEVIDFGDVSEFDGANLTFCVFSGLTFPPTVPGSLQHGFAVSTPIDPFQLGAVASVDLSGTEACTLYPD